MTSERGMRPPAGPEVADAVRAVLHEVRSRVGAVRLAVTALQEGGAHEELRGSLLDTADRETRRISTEIAGVAALATSLTDVSPIEAVDITAALRRAAAQVRRMGTQTRVRRQAGLVVRARSGALDAALPALIQLVADGDGEVVGSATRNGAMVVVRLRREDREPVKLEGSLADLLIRSAGARRESSEGDIGFAFRGGTS